MPGTYSFSLAISFLGDVLTLINIVFLFICRVTLSLAFCQVATSAIDCVIYTPKEYLSDSYPHFYDGSEHYFRYLILLTTCNASSVHMIAQCPLLCACRVTFTEEVRELTSFLMVITLKKEIYGKTTCFFAFLYSYLYL